MTSDPLSPETSPVTTTEQPVALDYVSQSAPGSPRHNNLPTQYLPGIRGIQYLPGIPGIQVFAEREFQQVSTVTCMLFRFQYSLVIFRKTSIGELFVEWIRD